MGGLAGQGLGSTGGLASQQAGAGKCEQIRKGSGQALESVSRPARTVHGYWKAWMVKVGGATEYEISGVSCLVVRFLRRKSDRSDL